MPAKQAWKYAEPDHGDRLHRVAQVRIWDIDKWGEPWDGYNELTHITGVTCCGMAGELRMPGLFSRMGAPRCLACCRAAHVLAGDGIPGNGEGCGPPDAWQIGWAAESGDSEDDRPPF